MDLILSKAINRAKLVKKRVPVRGKDGKIFYRMQWIDPNKDQTTEMQMKVIPEESEDMNLLQSSQSDDTSESSEEEKPHPETEVHSEVEMAIEKSPLRQEIDKVLKDMSKEEKAELISKHGVEYKHNDNPSIDNMNAIMALKRFLQSNPHLLNLEHLPDNVDKTPEGTDKSQDIFNSCDQNNLYSLMKSLGICDGVDPRTIQRYIDNNTAPIRHMNNLARLKHMAKGNPKILDSLTTGNEVGVTLIETGGNTVMGLLNTLSREQKYNLMFRLGICDGQDPKYDPALLASGKALSIHMSNMIQLKKMIEKDPSLVHKIDPKAELSKDELKKLNDRMSTNEKKLEIRKAVRSASQDLKSMWVDDLADNPIMMNLKLTGNENIDRMHKFSALVDIFLADPDLYNDFMGETSTEQLVDYKLTNKKVEKLLRRLCGIKGERAEVRLTEKNKEWSFGEGSFARKDFDDYGNPVFVVVDTGEDGDGWDEKIFKMEDVVAILEKGDTKKEQQLKLDPFADMPVEDRPYSEIMKAFKKNTSMELTPKILSKISSKVASVWGTSFDQMKLSGDYYVAYDCFPELNRKETMSMLRKLGVPCSEKSFNSLHANWLKMAEPDKFTSAKVMNANDYLITIGDKTLTTALHESARNWTSEERSTAKKEMLDSRVKVSINPNIVYEGNTPEIMEQNTQGVKDHIHRTLSIIPFDLLTDMLATSGFKGIQFVEKTGAIASYNSVDNFIAMDRTYLDTYHKFGKGNNLSEFNPGHTWWDKGDRQKAGLRPRALESFSYVLAHEFGHAIDHYLDRMPNGGNKSSGSFSDWARTPQGKKYAGKGSVQQSYKNAVKGSNPKGYLGVQEFKRTDRNGKPVTVKSFFMKDEWINAYEGRLYNLSETDVEKITVNGKEQYVLKKDAYYRAGDEHFAESFSRYLGAYNLYKETTQEDRVSFDEWVKNGAKAIDGGYYSHDELFSNSEGTQGKSDVFSSMNDSAPRSAYLMNKLMSKNPDMFNLLNNLVGRGDFVEGEKTYNQSEQYSSGNFGKSLYVNL